MGFSRQEYWSGVPLPCGSQQIRKFLKKKKKDGKTKLPYLSPEKPVCKSKQQLEPDMGRQTGSKLGKEYNKAVYCYSADLIHMQSTSYKMPGWMTHKMESRLLGEISTTSDMQMIPR